VERRELPVVEDMRCTSCQDCVRICPTDCLGWRSGLPVLREWTDCIHCGLCALICPAEAITMKDR
jgi:NAD-dependent dihydropyrimidine dehydrogenase PreA subunit